MSIDVNEAASAIFADLKEMNVLETWGISEEQLKDVCLRAATVASDMRALGLSKQRASEIAIEAMNSCLRSLQYRNDSLPLAER